MGIFKALLISILYIISPKELNIIVIITKNKDIYISYFFVFSAFFTFSID